MNQKQHLNLSSYNTQTMNPKIKLVSIPFIFRSIHADFKDAVLNTLDQIAQYLKDVHSAHIQQHPSDKEKYLERYEKKLAEIEELKLNYAELLQSRGIFTDAGFDGLEAIRWHLTRCIQEIITLVNLHNVDPKELYYLLILLRWGEFKTQYAIETYKIRDSGYRHFISSLIGLVFVFVPFFNFLSLILGLYQTTRHDWRARLLGLITLILFFIQATSIALVSWG